MPTNAGDPQNLVVSDQIRTQLLSAFRTAKGSHLVGPRRGTVYFAYLPATDTYWAMADFDLGPGATYEDQVNIQDGGNTGFFQHKTGHDWSTQVGDSPLPCPVHLPIPVLTLWGFSTAAESGCDGWKPWPDPLTPWK